jgi:3-methyl-2-oxobutanoate hydroxymethyltransferase
VVWDTQIAIIADRVGVELVSVGDSVGVNLWGHTNPLEVTMDEMIIVARAVRRGVRRALLSVDFPFGPLQEGPDAAVRAAVRLVKETGADIVKLDGAADHPDSVRAVTRAGIPVWAQFGVTPQTASTYGFAYGDVYQSAARIPAEMTEQLTDQALELERAGAVLLNITNAGEEAGSAVAAAVDIPVLGGFGGGPWLDGRIRMAHAAIGYSASMLDDPRDTYANVARTTFDALSEYADDVRSERQIRSGTPGR